MKSSWMSASTVALIALAMSSMPTAAGASVSGDSRLDAARAMELARDDDDVRNRLALRPVEYVVEATQVDFSNSADPMMRSSGRQWLVTWTIKGEDGPSLSATVDPNTHDVHASGQSLVVMPGRTTAAFTWFNSPATWLPLFVTFVLAVGLAPGGRRTSFVLAPFVVVAAMLCLTIASIVPTSFVRGGNIALFGVAAVALALGAVGWLAAARRAPAEAIGGRGPWWAWLIATGVGLASQVVGAIRTRLPIDVGFASYEGATLTKMALPVYGNTLDLGSLVSHADTYGPIAYLAYVPAIFVHDEAHFVSVGTNLVLGVLVAALLCWIGTRRADLSVGMWMAAVWMTCPFVAIGIAIGNNDVVVAAALAVLAVMLRRPAWRGVILAAATMTKFVPALLLLPLLRLRDEPRHVMLIVGGTYFASSAVLLVIAFRGIDAADEFWTRAVKYQTLRDDIASVWGLTGAGDLRFVATGAAVVIALWSIRAVHRHGEVQALFSMAAILALVIVGLPMYWGAYVTWLVPIVLFAATWRPEPQTMVSNDIEIVTPGHRDVERIR